MALCARKFDDDLWQFVQTREVLRSRRDARKFEPKLARCHAAVPSRVVALASLTMTSGSLSKRMGRCGRVVLLSSLTHGLQEFMMPLSLQTLTFGQDFHQSCLLTLTFGQDFDQSLQGITLPSSLQTLRSQGLVLQCNVQTLTFSAFFNKSSQGANLSSSLQTLTSGAVYQSLQRVELQHVLQHELAGCQSTKQPAYIDLWRHLPESATCRAAVQHVDQPADIDLQHFLQPELSQGLQMSFCQAARRHSLPPELDKVSRRRAVCRH